MTTLLPRSTWTDVARPTSDLVRLDPAAVRGFAVHYPGNPGSMGDTPTLTHTCQILEAERDYHVNGHGWSDIAYLGAVDQMGRVLDCRGAAYRSAANGDVPVNTTWGALTVLIGNKDTPTPAALNAVRWWRQNVWLPLYPHATAVVGHRDLHQTDCPGDALYAQIRAGALTQPPSGDADMPLTQDDANLVATTLISRFQVHVDSKLEPYTDAIGDVYRLVEALPAAVAAAVRASLPVGAGGAAVDAQATACAAATADELAKRLGRR